MNFGGFVLVVMMLTMIAISAVNIILVARLERTKRERDLALDLAENAAASEAQKDAQLRQWIEDYSEMYAEALALRRIASKLQETFNALQFKGPVTYLEIVEPWMRMSMNDLITRERAKAEGARDGES